MRNALICEFDYEGPPRFSRWCFSGGGAPDETRSTTVQELSPEQRQILEPVIPVAREFVEQPPTLFPGSGIVGFNPLQLQGQQAALGTTGTQQALANQGAGFTQFTLGPGLDPRTNPGLQGAISAATRPIIDNLTQRILPQLETEFSVLGQPGSSRAGIAQGLATQSALQQVGDTAANVVNPAFQASLEAGTRSLALLPQTIQSQLAPSFTLSGVGTQQQQLQQALRSEEISRFGQEQILPFLAAREAAQLAFGAPGGGATSAVTGQGTSTSPFLTGLGGAGAGAALGGTVGSVVPGVGTGIGALLGALLGGGGGFAFG